jgi:hypothetical protein
MTTEAITRTATAKFLNGSAMVILPIPHHSAEKIRPQITNESNVAINKLSIFLFTIMLTSLKS